MAVDPSRVRTLFLASEAVGSPVERATLLDRECGAEHRVPIRTTNLLVSVFSGMRLRHDKTLESGSRVACLTIGFKLIESASSARFSPRVTIQNTLARLTRSVTACYPLDMSSTRILLLFILGCLPLPQNLSSEPADSTPAERGLRRSSPALCRERRRFIHRVWQVSEVSLPLEVHPLPKDLARARSPDHGRNPAARSSRRPARHGPTEACQ